MSVRAWNRVGVRGQMVLLVAGPFALSLVLLGFLVVSSHISFHTSEVVQLRSTHLAAVWTVEVAADRYLDGLEGIRARKSPRSLRDLRASVIDAVSASLALARRLDGAEQVAEQQLESVVLELVRRGDDIPTGGDPARVAEVRRFYQSAVMPLLERRLVEEDQALRTSMAVARRWNAKLAAGGLVVTLTLLAGGVGAWLLIASRFSRGLRALAGHVRLLRAGEPVPPVRVRPGDELGELASAFNEMAVALQGQRQTRFRVLASVAHDLRNPLQALKLLSENVADYIQADDARRAMNVVRRQVGRMERLVTDLMDAAKIEAGDLELHMGPCDLVALARESVELYSATAPRHQVTLKAPERPIFVPCDSTRIAQVLNNLVSNAIKYSPRGGPVEVVVDDDEGACVAVADHGVGISPEDRTRIFEPFERLSSTVDLAAGAGLGLAIAKRIVAAHQGELSVESTVGGGSTFRVRFR